MNNLGPVADLERHLETDWWKKIFNATYLKTDADVVQDKNITKHEIDIILKCLNPDNSDYILDLACGQGRHLQELKERGFRNLFGLDRSRYLIQRARKKNKKEGTNIHYKEGDARQLPYKDNTFDIVTILGNSFGYFEKKDDDRKILSEVRRVLKPGGKLLMDIADGAYLMEHFVPRGWEWIDKKHFVCRERALASDNERLISREVVTHIEKGVVVDQFYAERLYTKQELTRLLNNSGFKATDSSISLEPDSLRDQDLGMMEKRFMLIATPVNKKKSPPIKRKIKNVAVIMGDPTIKDVVKPDGTFDEDDFEAINKLKSALNKLEPYSFHFLDHHDSLIEEVIEIKEKVDFVFNLCDEGFMNKARQELHVPALLEMIGIPYTGSGPQNLAYCYDKSLIRSIASDIEVPVANAFIVRPDQNYFEIALPLPVIVKPNFGDSGFGVTQESVVHNITELDAAIRNIREQFGYQKSILVEEFLTGAEVTLGIIGNPPGKHQILPVIEEDFSDLPDNLPKICGYEAKWITSSPYFTKLKSIPASLSGNTREEIINHSMRLFERLECRDYARFDWRLDKAGNPRLLEVNPNPGWCWDGHLAKASEIMGMSYKQMLKTILDAADYRIRTAQA